MKTQLNVASLHGVFSSFLFLSVRSEVIDSTSFLRFPNYRGSVWKCRGKGKPHYFFPFSGNTFNQDAKNEGKCFITGSKHLETNQSTRPWRCLESVMTHETRVFELLFSNETIKKLCSGIFSLYCIVSMSCVSQVTSH